MKLALIITAATLAGISLLVVADNADNARRQYAECIAASASAQGYTGNAHGPEAWQLFATNCN